MSARRKPTIFDAVCNPNLFAPWFRDRDTCYQQCHRTQHTADRPLRRGSSAIVVRARVLALCAVFLAIFTAAVDIGSKSRPFDIRLRP